MPEAVTTADLLARPESEIPSAWHAALVVLTSPAFGRHEHIGDFVDFTWGEDGSFDWQGALAAAETSGHSIPLLIRIAAAMFGNQPGADLADILVSLDEPNLKRLLLAIDVARGWMPFRDALIEAAKND